MKPERLEEILHARPPDEPEYRGRLRLGEQARARLARRPRRAMLVAAMGATALAALAVGLYAGRLLPVRIGTPSISPTAVETPNPSLPVGVIPWIDASPSAAPAATPTPAPDTGPACSVEDLALTADGWTGATGSLAGGATLVNTSSGTCHLGGAPAVDLVDADGHVIAGTTQPIPTPDLADLLALEPGSAAISGTVWQNWCADAPRQPLSIRLSLPGSGGTLSAAIRLDPQSTDGMLPRCDAPGGGSSFGAGVFSRPESSVEGTGRACAAGDLAAFLGRWGAAAGTSWAELVVLNVSGRNCVLASSPPLELRDAHGSLLSTAQPAGTSASVEVPAGQAAVTSIGYANWCRSEPALPTAFDLVIGSASLSVGGGSVGWVPACMDPGASPAPTPTLAYGSALALPDAPPPPELDVGNILPFAVKLGPLPAVAPGGTLDYLVTLTNRDPYGKPINLVAECPNYLERLSMPSGRSIDVRHALNCTAAGLLAAGASVTFAMQLAIPADAPVGTATLLWGLGDRGGADKKDFKIEDAVGGLSAGGSSEPPIRSYDRAIESSLNGRSSR